jgi:hypothetical protein
MGIARDPLLLDGYDSSLTWQVGCDLKVAQIIYIC